MQEITMDVLVMGHSAFKSTDRNGKPRTDENGNQKYDCKIKLGIGVGVAAFDQFISEKLARELSQSTGNGFQFGDPFEEYKARATFRPDVRSTTTKDSDRVRTQLVLRLINLEPATSGRRAAA